MTTKTEPRTVGLASAEGVYAPGIVAAAINDYKMNVNRRMWRAMLSSWDHKMTAAEVDRFLKGEIPYTLDGETVVITLE